MTKITITKNVAALSKGDTVEVTQGVATLLTNGGYAEVAPSASKRKPKTPTDTPHITTGGGASLGNPAQTAG